MVFGIFGFAGLGLRTEIPVFPDGGLVDLGMTFRIGIGGIGGRDFVVGFEAIVAALGRVAKVEEIGLVRFLGKSGSVDLGF